MIKEGPKPGVAHSEERDDDTFPYCGDTRHTTIIHNNDGTAIISTINPDNPGDGESNVVVYEADLPQ